jgi:hypothetical protein
LAFLFPIVFWIIIATTYFNCSILSRGLSAACPLTDRSNIGLLSTSRLARMVAAILKLDDLNKIVSQQEF